MGQGQVETKHTFCRICESLCGLEVEVKDNKIQKIRPDNAHVATNGFGCAKGLKQQHLYSSPDRLMYPMKRVGDKWERASWDTVNAEIGNKVKQLLRDHGPRSIGMYVGTAAGFGVLHPIFASGFMDALGSNQMYASATQDCSNKFAVSHHIYGFPFTQPHPDLFKTNCLIIVGANPVISKWSFLQVPNPSMHLKNMEARGAKVYVVDPRKTETAKVAGEHIFIKPGSDVYFYLSFLNEVIRQDGVQVERVQQFMKGYEQLVELAERWPAEKTEELTQIPAAVLKEMVQTYLAADGAALYCSTGVNMGGNGTLAFWIQECINAISGNLDREGGTLVGKGVIDFAKFGSKNGILMREDRSRIGNMISVNDAFPGGILADEIMTPGKDQLRAMFVTGGNPLLTMANANRLREAFQNLELLVCLDIQPSETASVGHYMLPCTSPMERPDLPFIFPLMLGLQVKPYLQATKAVVRPEGEQRDEATIYLDLAKAAGINLFGSAFAQRFLQFAKSMHSLRKGKDEQPSLPQEALLSLLLRVTKQGSFKKLLKQKHGVSRGEHETSSFLGERVYTEDGLMDLAPEILLKESQKLELDFHTQIAQMDRFRLISKRSVTTHNSWTHNYEEFVSGERRSNYLYMHSKDAERLGLENKALVDVSSETATVRLPIKLLDDLMPGTVALPHGWGHQSSGLSIAKKAKGVNVNILAADGPEKIDQVSGMVKLTGIIVDIKKADGPQADSWSGLERDVLQV
ncbi:MAG: molybdopterin-dependent oxidoreductase [Bacteroidota bacterium]